MSFLNLPSINMCGLWKCPQNQVKKEHVFGNVSAYLFGWGAFNFIEITQFQMLLSLSFLYRGSYCMERCGVSPRITCLWWSVCGGLSVTLLIHSLEVNFCTERCGVSPRITFLSVLGCCHAFASKLASNVHGLLCLVFFVDYQT